MRSIPCQTCEGKGPGPCLVLLFTGDVLHLPMLADHCNRLHPLHEIPASSDTPSQAAAALQAGVHADGHLQSRQRHRRAAPHSCQTPERRHVAP